MIFSLPIYECQTYIRIYWSEPNDLIDLYGFLCYFGKVVVAVLCGAGQDLALFTKQSLFGG